MVLSSKFCTLEITQLIYFVCRLFYSLYITSFKHKNQIKEGEYQFHFTEEETEIQKCYLAQGHIFIK